MEVTAEMKVGVIGAGVGGLTFACALQAASSQTRSALTVEVFEQAPALSAVGAGVSIGPKVLSKLPERVAGLISEQGTSMIDASVFTLDGTHVYSGGWPQAPIDNSHGVSILRSDLQDILLSEVARTKTTVIHLGYRAVQYTTSNSEAEVLFDNGERRRFDLIVACDGIWSPSAAVINPKQRLQEHGSMALRAVVNHRALAGTKFEVGSSTHLWVGYDRNFLCYPVDGGEKMYVTAYTKLNPDVSKHRDFSTNTVRFYRDAFSGEDPRITALLDLIHIGQVRSVISRTAPSNLSNGRLVAVGDSVGAMCSHSAQGANTAMLSAIVLGQLVAELPDDRDSLDNLTNFYNEKMLDTVSRTQRYAQNIADIYHDGSFARLEDKVEKIRHTVLCASGVLSTCGSQLESRFP